MQFRQAEKLEIYSPFEARKVKKRVRYSEHCRGFTKRSSRRTDRCAFLRAC